MNQKQLNGNASVVNVDNDNPVYLADKRLEEVAIKRKKSAIVFDERKAIKIYEEENSPYGDQGHLEYWCSGTSGRRAYFKRRMGFESLKEYDKREPRFLELWVGYMQKYEFCEEIRSIHLMKSLTPASLAALDRCNLLGLVVDGMNFDFRAGSFISLEDGDFISVHPTFDNLLFAYHSTKSSSFFRYFLHREGKQYFYYFMDDKKQLFSVTKAEIKKTLLDSFERRDEELKFLLQKLQDAE
jgi:hypothetical protein